MQINLHNSKAAQTELEVQIGNNKHPTIALLQEPPTPNKQIKYPKDCTKFNTPEKTRATILIPKGLNFTEISSLTTKFCLVIKAQSTTIKYYLLVFIYKTHLILFLPG